MSAVLIFVSGH